MLPGGNTRTGVFVDPFPLYIDHAEGTELIGVDRLVEEIAFALLDLPR